MFCSLSIIVALINFIPSSSSSPLPDSELSNLAATETDLLLNDLNITECIKNQLCNNGQCVKISPMKTSCICFRPFVDFQGHPCKEKGSSKLVAFLLSFFVGGFGADWFYLSRGDADFIIIGILKCFITGILPFFLFCCGMSCYAIYQDRQHWFWDGMMCLSPLLALPISTGSIWWLVDWIRIISGSWEKDGMDLFLYIDM